MKIMWNDAKITGYVTSVTWAGSAKQAARTVVFSVAYSPNDKNVKTLGIKLGDKIVFYPGYPDDKKTKFVGIITQRERKSEMGELQYTATDGMMHLLRSSGTYRFANKTPEKIAQMVCRDVKVKTGSIAKTKMPIAKIFFQERPYYEIIMAAYTKAYRKNKKKYIAQMNGDKLEVIQKGKVIPNFHIRQGERITESSYTEDLDSMVNRVYIYDSNNNKIGSVSNSNWIKKYGIFQNAISVDSGNGKTEAKAELQGINKTASDHGIATIDGYYLVAVGSYFGSCGDLISFTLEGGIKLNCLVADEKNAGDSSGSVYGHWQDYPASGWSIIEWESMGGSDYSNSGALLNVSQWQGKKVTAAINGGRYQGL